MKCGVAVLLLAALSSSTFAQTPEAPASQGKEATISSRTSNLKRQDGFVPFFYDQKKGALLFELAPALLDHDLLYFSGLGSGVGSLEMFADRSTVGNSGVIHFHRAGPRVLVIQENERFRATNGSADQKQSVALSFPTSVIASMPIEAEQDGTLLVNANSLVVRDATNLMGQLRRPTINLSVQINRPQASGGAAWRLDDSRCAVDMDHTRAFPLNTEVEAILTFANDGGESGGFGAGNSMNQPESRALTISEHQSFVALPPPGYEIREADPRVGFFGVTFQDFSQPFNKPLVRTFIERWRLQKKDPNAAVSEPIKPLTFYLDRGMPEPIRAAARRGAMWWNQAFEQAGFKNAVQVLDLPEGADPLDMRYPVIQWTNRAGRGWSVGMSQADPRTGEILHSVVQLDSHRMRTVHRYWDAILPPASGRNEQALDMFAEFDTMDPNLSEEQLMLNRLALLTCHEVGHVLGLDHNFVASTFGRGSVMDYYAPRVKIRADGSPDLSDAYMQGVGSYDRAAIEWGYSQGRTQGTDANGETIPAEKQRLEAIWQKALKAGIWYGNYEDPRWNAYDDGTDPVTWLRDVIPVRDALLKRYGAQLLRPGEPSSELASRFPLIYLFHRYALGSAINVIGSAKIPPMLAGDGQVPITIWPADSQREALRLALSALDSKELAISPELWKVLSPPENRDRDPERFTTSAEYLFSPEDGARAISEVVIGGLLDPHRMQRLIVERQQDSSALSAQDLVDAIVRACFSGSAGDNLADAVRTDAADRLMALAVNDAATPEVQALAFYGVAALQKQLKGTTDINMLHLDSDIDRFFRDPKQYAPKPKPSGAPPGPPVG